VAKRKQNENNPLSVSREEYRNGVRAYAAPLLAEMLRKQQISVKLPEEPMKTTLAIGCIRWGILAMEQERIYCMSEQDREERMELQETLE